ncbi:MAG TPA: SGNH/GDSL hydrolase family protein [Rhodospirillales bacterium]|nr:SGNH/GDSL hydrolase family protein [Rhodospirillales bacterium]
MMVQPAFAAPAFDGLVVFGDSLSDNGNAGRFSDGPVWVEVIARQMGVELRPSRAGGTNYAVGGARTHGGPADLRAQVHDYLKKITAGDADPGTLLIVYAGANDLLARGCGRQQNGVAKTAAAAVTASVNDLAAAGARHILVPNLPDIGVAPAIRMQGGACAEQARRLTRAFNAALQHDLPAVETRHDVRIILLDVFALTEAVLADPREAGFEDVEMPCLHGDCRRALFWDHLHPSSYAHARLAAAALRTLDIHSGD